MMYRVTLVVLSCVWIAGCSGGSIGNSADPYDRAQAASESYQFDKADSLYAALEKADSSGARAYYQSGVNQERQLLLWDALEEYLQALTRDVKYAPAYGGLYRVFSMLGSPVLAADAAKTCAELSASDVEAWRVSASAYIDAGQFGEAQRSLSQAEAAGLAKDAVALLKARMEFLRHEYAASAGSAAVAVTTADGRRSLSRYLEAREMGDSATTVARGLFHDEKSHQALLDYFFTALRSGSLYDARLAIAEMEKRDKSGGLGRAALVFYYDRSGEYVQGRGAATQLSELRPHAISSFAYLVQTANRTANLTVSGAAGDEMMANIQASHMHPILKQYAIYRRITPRARMMVPPEVVIALDSITMIPMRSELEFQAWYAYALASVHKFNNVGDSVPTFEQFTSAWANHPALWTAFAATRMGFSPVAAIRAESLLTSVLERDAHYKPAFDSLWVVYRFCGEFAKGAELFAKYPQFVEQYGEAGMQAAISMADVGRIGEAVTAAERVLPLVGQDALLMDQLTRSMERHAGGTEAFALLEKCLAVSPKNGDLLLLAARVACDNGDCRKGMEFVERGLKLEPESRPLLTEKGRILFDSGEEEKGLAQLKEQIGGDIANPDGLIYLSRRLASRPETADQGQDMARQAVNVSPIGLRAMVNLSHVCMVSGKYDMARGAAKTALEIYPNDPEIYYLLGKAMFNERKPEAKEHLQKAVQLGVAGDQLHDAEAMLQRL